MKKCLLNSTVFLFISLFSFVSSSFALPPEKAENLSVLILNSYHQGFEWSDNELEMETMGLMNVFPDIRIYVEHMDHKRFPGDFSKWQIFQKILSKFEKKPPSIIIANDNVATHLALRLKEQVWPDIPVVFAGYSAPQNLPSPLPSDVKGIVESLDANKIIDLIKIQNPGIKSVFIIADMSITWREIVEDVRMQLQDRRDLSFTYIQKETLDELEPLLSEIPQDSAVLLLPCRLTKEGQFFHIRNLGRYVAKMSLAPVYITNELFLGTGVIGGYMPSGKEHGEKAAQLALRVLVEGDDASYLISSKAHPIFDYDALLAHNINPNTLPKDAVLINGPKLGFLERNRAVIQDVLLFIGAVILGITVLAIYARKKSDEDLQAIFDALDQSVLLIDAQTYQVIRQNRAALEILGFDPSSDVELSIRDFWLATPSYNESAAMSLFDKCREEGLRHFPWRIQQKNGLLLWVDVNIQYIVINKRRCFLAVSQNVTERYEMELELEKHRNHLEEMVEEKTVALVEAQKDLELARDEAIQANETKSQFFANMSHELRTPLTGVVGLMELLANTFLGVDQKNYVKRALTSGRQLLATINDVLDVSKMEQGEILISNEPFDLGQVVQVMEDSVFLNPDKDVAYIKDMGVALPLGLVGDRFRLGQILINLFANAAKFTEQGSITLAIKELHQDAQSIGLRFEIRDTGLGLTKEAQEKLFAPYFQVEGSAKKFVGTGLGLSICKTLVELMGGRIGVESEFGLGSTFWFELDFEKSSEALAEEESTEILEDDSDNIYAGKTFLLMEDNEINIYMLKAMLLSAGALNVLLAYNGEQGLQLLAENSTVDCVLADVQMPVMDGIEATKQIRAQEKYKDLPIVAMTANVFAVDGKRCMDAGMTAYLSKPFTAKELYDVLNSLPAFKKTED